MSKPKPAEAPTVYGLILLTIGLIIRTLAANGLLFAGPDAGFETSGIETAQIWANIGAGSVVIGVVLLGIGVARVAQGMDYLVKIAPNVEQAESVAPAENTV